MFPKYNIVWENILKPSVNKLNINEITEPNNKDLKDEYDQVINLIEQGEPTLPTTISKELKINPFLRCNSEGIKNTIKNKFNLEGNEEEIFSALRKWKDNF